MPWKLSPDPRITARALERQMRNWQIARAQRPERPPVQRPEVEDFLTLSRQPGSGAGEVAKALGERLGWPVFGRNLLETMAGDDATRRLIYSSLDQRDLKWWQEALYAMFGKGFVRNDYFRRLCETVLSLARQGNCIFIGRGCDRMLPQDLGFRVRLVAPEAHRVEQFRLRHRLSEAEARLAIQRIERERAEFLRRHFRVDAEDVTRHDLTLNVGRVAIPRAVEIILAARELALAAPRGTPAEAGATRQGA